MALRLNGSSSGYVELDVPAAAGSHTLTLPDGGGSSGQYLQTDGSGGLSWATVTPSTPIQILSVTGRQVSTRNVLTQATMGNIRLGSATISSSDINSAAKVWEVSYTPTNNSGTARIDALLNSFCEDTNGADWLGVALVAKNGTTWSVVDFENLAHDWDGVFGMWSTQSLGTVNDGAARLSLSGKVDVANLNTIAVIGYGATSIGDISINDIGNNTTTYTTQQYTSFIQVTEY